MSFGAVLALPEETGQRRLEGSDAFPFLRAHILKGRGDICGDAANGAIPRWMRDLSIQAKTRRPLKIVYCAPVANPFAVELLLSKHQRLAILRFVRCPGHLVGGRIVA